MNISLAVWSNLWFEDGDYIILRRGGQETTRYRINKAKWQHNPRDMFILNATFSPRKVE